MGGDADPVIVTVKSSFGWEARCQSHRQMKGQEMQREE